MMQEDNPSPFTPFEPQLTATTPPTAQQPPKRERKRKAAAAKSPKTPKAPKQITQPAVAAQQPPRKKRKRRVPSAPQTRQPRGLKLPVNIVLAATGKLKASDAAVFEKVLGILSGAAKGQRKRVLDALGKVFA